MSDDTHNTLRMMALDALAAGMAGTNEANAALSAATEKRKSAYTHFVEAALVCSEAAEPATLLADVADSLFAEIRVSATVTNSAGNTAPVSAKPDKDGKGFVIPSSFSAAKSYLLTALERKVPLYGDEGQPLTYSQIRKTVDVMRDEEKRASATGDDRIRMDLLDTLAALTEQAKTVKGGELADLYRRISRAAKPAVQKPAAAPAPEQAAALAAAA